MKGLFLMPTTFCFVTKNNNVTNRDLKKVEAEFHKSNYDIVEKTRLGVDCVVLKIRNFFPGDFKYLERELSIDINFSVKSIEIKKVLVADMDSTIIRSECIEELAEYAGVRAEIAILTEKAMAGEINFIEALEKRVKLLTGLTVQQLSDCYHKKIRFNKGARTLVNTMSSLGSLTAIISGGFSFFADKVATDIGFDQAYANKLIFEGNALSGTVQYPILSGAQKQVILNKICYKGKFDLSEVIAVGDGANDIEIIRSAGIGVSFYGKQALTLNCDFKLYYSNLRALLYFQGIKESDFVTQ